MSLRREQITGLWYLYKGILYKSKRTRAIMYQYVQISKTMLSKDKLQKNSNCVTPFVLIL